MATINNNITLQMTGAVGPSISNNVSMRIEGDATALNTFTTLMVYGGGTPGSSWTIKTAPLFLQVDPNVNSSIALFLKNTQSFLANNDSLPLIIFGRNLTVNNNISLFLQNNGISNLTNGNGVSLYIHGLGQFPGNTAVIDQLQCYVHRPNQSVSLPLLLFNNTPTLNSFVPLRITGISGVSSKTATLVIPNVHKSAPNAFATLFMNGAVSVVTEMTLAMPETRALINNSIPLVLFHDGAIPNATMTLFLDGVFKNNGFITMAIPSVVGTPNNNLSLYIRGY